MAAKTAWAVMIGAGLAGGLIFNARADADHHSRNHSDDTGWEAAETKARGSAQEVDFRWTGQLDADEWLTVQTVNGDIEVEPSAGSEIEVVATMRSRSGDVDALRVEVVETRRGVTLCAIFPSRKSGERAECAGESFDRPQVDETSGSIDFMVRAPAALLFRGTTVNGDVDIEGDLGEVDARTVNGSIEATARGAIQAATVNGSIDAVLTEERLSGPVDLQTVNGSLSLDMVDGVDADLRASWLTGSFRSDLPVQIRGRVQRSASGTLGDGGERVTLKTVNGGIEIR